MKNLTVLAIGGNAIGADSPEKESENILKTFDGAEELIKRGPLVITHGNGPQVGRLLAKLKLPLWLHTGQTQGEISSLLQLNLRKHLKSFNIEKPIVSLMSHVLINPEDATFGTPTKPVGIPFNKQVAQKLIQKGFNVEKDLRNPDFFRRLVPSPEPVDVIEMQAIRILLKNGYIVITGGGGGIPIQKTPTGPKPIEAIVDKDYTSSIIASGLNAETLIFLTGVEYVMSDFGGANEQPIKLDTVSIFKNLLEKDHFKKLFKTGMRTKIDAAIKFLEKGGSKVIIGSTYKLKEMIAGKSGTSIFNFN